jgi:uncharacterized protein with NRDE domain
MDALNMCVVALGWQVSDEWPLVLIGNRDEYHARPAAPLAGWDDGTGIIAGRDLQSGGTWLGVSTQGRLAVITNVRNARGPDSALRTRGELVTGALVNGPRSLESREGAKYNCFNLIVAEWGALSFCSNHPEDFQSAMEPGVYGVSNGAFDEPWPKVNFLKQGLAEWIAASRGDTGGLFALLANDGASGRYGGRLPTDFALIEAQDTPAFIRHAAYGTRCSTVVAIRGDGSGIIAERSFDHAGNLTGEVSIPFQWPKSAAPK